MAYRSIHPACSIIWATC